MTRLKEEDILDISNGLKEYNQKLINQTGKSLQEIAAYATGSSPERIYGFAQAISVAVIPITSGEGIINGFSQSVQKIIEFMGFPSFVTGLKDVGGLAEAVEKGAGVVFLADDDHFVAIHIAAGKVVDNAKATGKGYAAALDLMAGGLSDKEVLLLGAGPVGIGAAEYMSAHGARISVYDVNFQQAGNLIETVPGMQMVRDFYQALPGYKLILDATPAAEIIGRKHIGEDTLIAAPGIPLGLSRECLPLIADRLVHDALEIGVATMLFDVLS